MRRLQKKKKYNFNKIYKKILIKLMINKLHKKLPEIADRVQLWGKYMGVEKKQKS